MTVKEINDNFNKISKEIQTTLDNSIFDIQDKLQLLNIYNQLKL